MHGWHLVTTARCASIVDVFIQRNVGPVRFDLCWGQGVLIAMSSTQNAYTGHFGQLVDRRCGICVPFTQNKSFASFHATKGPGLPTEKILRRLACSDCRTGGSQSISRELPREDRAPKDGKDAALGTGTDSHPCASNKRYIYVIHALIYDPPSATRRIT